MGRGDCGMGVRVHVQAIVANSKRCSDAGTRTRVSCVKGKYANHLHHIGLQLDAPGAVHK